MKVFIPMTILVLSTLLTGCAATSDQTSSTANSQQQSGPTVQSLINTADFGQRADIPSMADIFTLTPAQQQHFFNYFNDPVNASVLPHSRVYNFLSEQLSSFTYYGQTYTAQQSLDNNSGNCMSLAILTTAYARLAGIEFTYAESTSNPTYSTTSNFELVSGHVVTKLYDPTFRPKKNMLYIKKPHLIVDYFPTRNSWRGPSVSANRFVGMYYRNLSADALQQGQPQRAAWLNVEALKYGPNDPANVNLMAVIYRHLNQYNKAESLYQHGLALKKKDLYLMNNYRILLLKQNRLAAAQTLRQSMDELDDPSPFRWLSLANQYLRENNNDNALKYYKRAIEKAHYLPQGYAGAAKVYYLTGRPKLAKKLFEQALSKTHDDKTEALYEAKLAVLTMN
ncbi:MAG: Tfp pilus assembly protein PilF [Phenylobacterium sp.]|jgi:Tfp pilus assembly protein PilF